MRRTPEYTLYINAEGFLRAFYSNYVNAAHGLTVPSDDIVQLCFKH